MKLCQICKKREATIFLNIFENKKMIKDAGICSKCMEQFGFPTDPNFAMNKLLNKLKTLAFNNYDEDESIEIYRCRTCGLSQSEFDYDMSLGCPKCYKYFSDSLDDVIHYIRENQPDGQLENQPEKQLEVQSGELKSEVVSVENEPVKDYTNVDFEDI